MSNGNPLTPLGFHGLIHLWGIAGSGKTLFAVAIASEISKFSNVEWINADGKKSFVNQLKKNVVSQNGKPENIVVTLIQDSRALVDEIHSLSERIHGTALIVIDPITRVLDMARKNPILWGQEIVEDVLPTLAGIVERFGVDIIITSECRLMNDSVNHAVHHETITKWVDHDLHIQRDPTGLFSHVLISSLDKEKETAVLRITEDGIVNVIPRAFPSELTEGIS